MSADAGVIVVPATPMQEALWWLHQRARNRAVYNLTWRLGCDAPIDVVALESAWQAVIDRHDALRSCLRRRDERLEWVVLPELPVALGRLEINDPGPSDPATLLRSVAEELQNQVFELNTAGLSRLTLVRVAEQSELVISVHHVSMDGWALQLLIADLSLAYEAILDGREPVFPIQAAHFHDYVRQQQDIVSSDHWRAGLDYWRNTLDGAVAVTVVGDRPGEFVTGATGEVFQYAFSAEAAAGITALAKLTFATPFAIVLSALNIVLARGGAGTDIAVGVVVANRVTASDQFLVGYAANLCISRTAMSPHDRISDVVERCRDAMWQMLMHQAVPYPLVYGQLSGPTRDGLGDTPSILLSYLGGIGDELRLGKARLWRYPSPNRTARADIATSFWSASGVYLAEVEFNAARYRRETVLSLMHDIDEVLATAGSAPTLPVQELATSSRSALGNLDHRRNRVDADPVPLPESAGWRQLGQAWAQLVGSPPSGPDADFFAEGGNSLLVARLASLLHDSTGADLDMVEWLAEPTPRRAVRLLSGGPAAAPDTPAGTVLTLQAGTGIHLHLIHGAGGGSQDYRELVAALPSDWQITLSSEGLGAEDLTTVPRMAERYRQDLAAAGMRPDVVGGWSLGGQIAYHLVADLPAPRPTLLILDATPPVSDRTEFVDPQQQWFATFATAVGDSLGLDVREALPSGSDTALMIVGLAALLAASGQPVSAALLAERWRTYLRHVRAVASYTRASRVETRALIVGADLAESQLAQWALRVTQPRWLRVDTDHYGLLHQAAATEIAAETVELCATAVQI